MRCRPSLEQTLRYRKMLQQGITPEQYRSHARQQAREKTIAVMSELQQRQQALGQTVASWTEELRSYPFWEDGAAGVKVVEQVIDGLERYHESLSQKLEESSKMLAQQQQQKHRAQQALEAYKHTLESTPSDSLIEQVSAKGGRKLCQNIRGKK